MSTQQIPLYLLGPTSARPVPKGAILVCASCDAWLWTFDRDVPYGQVLKETPFEMSDDIPMVYINEPPRCPKCGKCFLMYDSDESLARTLYIPPGADTLQTAANDMLVLVDEMKRQGYPEYEGQNMEQFINSIGVKAANYIKIKGGG